MTESLVPALLKQIEAERNPLGVLRLPAIAEKPGDWTFRLLRRLGTLDLLIEPGVSISRDILLTLAVPEILYGDYTTISYESGSSEILPGVFGSQESSSSHPVTDVKVKSITIHNYNSGTLPAEFTKEELIHDFLERWTWLGSHSYSGSPFTIRVSVLATDYEFATRNAEAPGRPHSFDVPLKGPGSLRIEYGYSDRTFTVRSARYGYSPTLSESIAKLGKVLSDAGIRGGALEVDVDGLVDIGLGGKEIVTGVLDDLIDSNALTALEDLAEARSRIDELRRIRQKKDLDRRMKAALTDTQVYCSDRHVGVLPNSEQATVMIFHILEGMGGLPFAHFKSRAWTPKRGIDIIADYSVLKDEPLKMARPVEFEFKIENYFAHGHEANQTDGIICWQCPPATFPGLSTTGDAWRWELEIGTQRLWVAAIERFPGIELRDP